MMLYAILTMQLMSVSFVCGGWLAWHRTTRAWQKIAQESYREGGADAVKKLGPPVRFYPPPKLVVHHDGRAG